MSRLSAISRAVTEYIFPDFWSAGGANPQAQLSLIATEEILRRGGGNLTSYTIV